MMTLLLAAVHGMSQKELAQVRKATAKYHDVAVAEADGYVNTMECVSNPAGEGAMGVHFVNFGLLDGTVTADAPEVLVYAQTHHGYRLVAAEYLILGPELDPLPSILGQEMEHHDEPGHPLGPHHELHAWIWQANPSGIFADFNPNVECPAE